MVHSFLLVLLACAVSSAQMMGLGVLSPNQVVAASVQNSKLADGSQDIAIDVTDAFVDQLDNDHMLQVNVSLTVAKNVVSISNQIVTLNQLSSLRLSAMLYEKIRATGEVVAQRPVSVVIQVSVLTGPSTINVQELIREIDGTRFDAVAVQEAILETDENGNEVDRSVTTIAIAESRLNVVTTAAPATDASPNSPNSPDSPDSPNSPNSPFEGHGFRDCRLKRWYGRQSFGVRVLVAAAASFMTVLVLYLLFRCCRFCCCGVNRSRSVYLDNVKMHYEALPVDDKKQSLIV